MTEILIPAAIVGLMASVITEIIKLFPWFQAADDRKKVLAGLICLVVSFIYIGTQIEPGSISILSFILVALSATFTAFKAVIQPVEAVFRPAGQKIRSLFEGSE